MKRSLKEMRSLLDAHNKGPDDFALGYKGMSNNDVFIAAAPSMVADLLHTLEELRKQAAWLTRYECPECDSHRVGKEMLSKLDAATAEDGDYRPCGSCDLRIDNVACTCSEDGNG